MFNIIVACTLDLGIGKTTTNSLSEGQRTIGQLPWQCSEELASFKRLTNNSILIMGRKTVETLPCLPERRVFCVSKSGLLSRDNNNSMIFPSLEIALQYAYKKYPTQTVFVAGGGQIYSEALKQPENIRYIYMSIMRDMYACDIFLNIDLSRWVIKENKQFKYFELNTLYYDSQEAQYLSMLNRVLTEGKERQTRNAITKSCFDGKLTFNLIKGFPLLTTKKMFFRGIFEELMFFIKGETDSNILKEKGVNIWVKNTCREFLDNNGKSNMKEGLMGPMYGYQWRHFGAEYNQETGLPKTQGIDQLQNVIDMINKDPTSRRIIMTDYNPTQADQGVLFPCHSLIIQFYVDEGFLDMKCFNRSQDLFLGTPFNIASSALFLTLIANVCGLIPRLITMDLGDIHIYKNHYEQVETQLKRQPFAFPTLLVKRRYGSIAELENARWEDLDLVNYNSHPSIRAEMIG